MTAQIATPSILQTLVQQQRNFFSTGQTKPIAFRTQQLQNLQQAITKYQSAIVEAAKQDLGRPEYEAYFEIATVAEIKQALKSLKQWMKPKRVASPIDQFPSTAWIQQIGRASCRERVLMPV